MSEVIHTLPRDGIQPSFHDVDDVDKDKAHSLDHDLSETSHDVENGPDKIYVGVGKIEALCEYRAAFRFVLLISLWD